MTNAEERELCRMYEGRIRGYGLRHLRDAALAEDLVQHVLLVVLQAARAGRVAQPDRFVLGTCRYAVRDMQRGEVRQRRIEEQQAAVLPSAYEPSLAPLDRGRVEMCLMKLEPRARSIVLATFVYDRDADEIGQSLELTPNNVRVIRHRALAKLQACVGGVP